MGTPHVQHVVLAHSEWIATGDMQTLIRSWSYTHAPNKELTLTPSVLWGLPLQSSWGQQQGLHQSSPT